MTDQPEKSRTRYQERVIRNYYRNRRALALQKLGEHITELYLEQGAARRRRWGYIRRALEQLDVPKSRIEHLVQQDDPALLARLMQELQARG